MIEHTNPRRKIGTIPSRMVKKFINDKLTNAVESGGNKIKKKSICSKSTK